MLIGWALLGAGCAGYLSWSEQRPAALPEGATRVAVVVADRACLEVGEALVAEIRARRNVEVAAGARTVLVVQGCETEVRAEVDVRIDGASEERRTRVVGRARGEVMVLDDGWEVGLFQARVVREANGEHGGRRLRRAAGREVAARLADQLAPAPEHLRRRYRGDAPPGSAGALLDAAVLAERNGDLRRALELARQAYAIGGEPAALRYVGELERRAEQVGLAAGEDPSREAL